MKLIGKIIILILLSSCSEPQIYFSKSQPDNKRNERKIKKDYCGQFLSLSDSSILKIEIDKITREQYIDTLICDTLNCELIFNLKKQGTKRIDTIFTFNSEYEMKYSKGIYFINKKLDEKKWTLQLLRKKENDYIELLRLCDGESIFTLDSIETICDINEIENLKNYSKIKVSYQNNDSTKVSEYEVEIKKKDLMEYIKNGGFLHIETFKRIK